MQRTFDGCTHHGAGSAPASSRHHRTSAGRAQQKQNPESRIQNRITPLDSAFLILDFAISMAKLQPSVAVTNPGMIPGSSRDPGCVGICSQRYAIGRFFQLKFCWQKFAFRPSKSALAEFRFSMGDFQAISGAQLGLNF